MDNNKYDDIKDILENTDDETLREIWNGFSSETIYTMNEIDDYVGDYGSIVNLFQQIDMDNFDIDDEYFYEHDVYGIRSLSYVTDCDSPIDIDKLADNSIDYDEDYGIEKIREILNRNPLADTVEEIFETYDIYMADVKQMMETEPETIIATLVDIIND